MIYLYLGCLINFNGKIKKTQPKKPSNQGDSVKGETGDDVT